MAAEVLLPLGVPGPHQQRLLLRHVGVGGEDLLAVVVRRGVKTFGHLKGQEWVKPRVSGSIIKTDRYCIKGGMSTLVHTRGSVFKREKKRHNMYITIKIFFGMIQWTR